MKGTPKEISVLDLLSAVWAGRFLVLKCAAAALIIGLIIAFTTPREWKANTKIIVNANGSSLNVNSSLSGLAGLAGITLPTQQAESVNMMLFEDILKEDAFITRLLQTRFYYPAISDSITFSDYCAEYMRNSLLKKVQMLPGKVIGLFKSEKEGSGQALNEGFLFLSSSQRKLYDALKARITVGHDLEKGISQVGILMQDPYMAAQVTEFSRKYLEHYILDLSTKQDQTLLAFISDQLRVKEAVFREAQAKLAEFRDQNIRLATNAPRAEEQQLQTDYDIAYQLYLSMAQAKEEIEIELEKKLPVFQDMSAITVPSEVLKPKKLVILITAIVLGVLLGVIFILLKTQLSASGIMSKTD